MTKCHTFPRLAPITESGKNALPIGPSYTTLPCSCEGTKKAIAKPSSQKFIQERPILLKFEYNKWQVAIYLVLKFQSKIFTTFDAIHTFFTCNVKAHSNTIVNICKITILLVINIILTFKYNYYGDIIPPGPKKTWGTPSLISPKS
eukprot:sb/3473843/